MAPTDSRDRLLDVAEALFAENGVRGVSLRAINAAAGLSSAALHYHFGSRSAVVEAILARRVPILMERRRVLLDEIERNPDQPSVRGIVAVLAMPLIELLDREPDAGRRYIRFLARVYGDRDFDTESIVKQFRLGTERIQPLVERALPELPRALVHLRLTMGMEVILRALANPEISTLEGEYAIADAAFPNVLIDFVTGAIEAPNSLSVKKLQSKKAVGGARKRR